MQDLQEKHQKKYDMLDEGILKKNLRFLHNNNLVDANSWLKKPSLCSSSQQGKIIDYLLL